MTTGKCTRKVCCTCRVVVLLNKTIAHVLTFSLPSPSSLLKLPTDCSRRSCFGRECLYFFAVLLQVGLQILPLDGNPHKTMALIAHPEGVSLFASASNRLVSSKLNLFSLN